MKKLFCGFLSLSLLLMGGSSAIADTLPAGHKLLYQGHGSLRIVTSEGKVIYIDPYAGEGYDLPADLILVSHGHRDHNAVDLIRNCSKDCQIIYNTDALVKGEYKTFDLGYATVEAVQAGNNRNHDINVCVGWLITLSDGVSVYASGDTSTTDQWLSLHSGIYIMRSSSVMASSIWIWMKRLPAPRPSKLGTAFHITWLPARCLTRSALSCSMCPVVSLFLPVKKYH